MEFIIGDKVSFLNEKLDGVVSKIVGANQVVVDTEDGFGFPVMNSELILIHRDEKSVKKEAKKLEQKEATIAVESSKEKQEEDIFAPLKKIKKEKEVIGREHIRKSLQDRFQMKVVGNISLKHSHRRKEVEGEVDLHIENLLDSWKNMSNGEIVLHQLSIARERIDDAILAGKHRLLIIHGVGNGTLKKEVKKLVSTYPGLRSEDAPFSISGGGSTVVHL